MSETRSNLLVFRSRWDRPENALLPAKRRDLGRQKERGWRLARCGAVPDRPTHNLDGGPMLTLTDVLSTKIRTRNGERLHISAPHRGYSMEFDPLELEDLTWQPGETFSQLSAIPLGSDEGGVEARLLSDWILFGGEHG